MMIREPVMGLGFLIAMGMMGPQNNRGQMVDSIAIMVMNGRVGMAVKEPELEKVIQMINRTSNT